MRRLAALSLAVGLSVCICARAEDSPVRILYGGTGHGYEHGDLPERMQPGWLALAVRNGVWWLTPASFSMSYFSGSHDPEGQNNSVALAVTPADSLVLLDLPELVPGKVDTPDVRFKNRPRMLEPTTALTFAFKAREWSLRVDAGELILSDGTSSMSLGEVADDMSEHHTELLWAGDLDHDGRLDLVLERTGIDGAALCVWLSSLAALGQLVGKAACFEPSGC